MRFFTLVCLMMVSRICFGGFNSFSFSEMSNDSASGRFIPLGGYGYKWSTSFLSKDFFHETESQLTYHLVQWGLPPDEYAISRTYYWPSYIMWSFILPKTLRLYDKSSVQLYGYQLQFSAHGYSFISKDAFIFAICEGVDFGRIRVTDELNKRAKNGYLGPFITLFTNIRLGPVKFYSACKVNTDISHARWKKMWVSEMIDQHIPGYRNHGVEINFGLIWDSH